MQRFIKHSGLLLIIFSLLNPVCASAIRVLPGQSSHGRTISVSTQVRNEPVAAMVKAEKANLRDRPSLSGTVLRTVTKGDLLGLIDAQPIGPWYRVRDSRSDSAIVACSFAVWLYFLRGAFPS